MKLIFTLIILINLLITPSTFGQIKFEKGYFIDSHGQKVICYIKNQDWENNPRSFQYKFETNGEALTGTLQEAKEFAIDSAATYVRARVSLDYNMAERHPTSFDKNPAWIQEELFLKVLVKGTCTLYAFKNNQFTQFYFRRKEGEFNPLIYKTYLNDKGEVETNVAYQQQLWNELKCEALERDYLSRIRYRENDLVSCFQKYNVCADPKFVANIAKNKLKAFHLSLNGGLDYVHFKTNYDPTLKMDKSLSTNLSLRIGTGIEYIAPFNRGKWGILMEPSFQYYHIKAFGGTAQITPSFWSVEAPMGIRHYFFLDDNLKVFVNMHYIAKIYAKQFKVDWFGTNHIEMGNNFSIGAGLVKGRFSSELRYIMKRNVFVFAGGFGFTGSKLSLILSYRIFSK